MVGGCHITVDLLRSSTLVVASGPKVTLIEIGEVLAWVSTAFRSSRGGQPPEYCTPKIIAEERNNRIDCRISYVYETTSAASETSGCWYKMLNNPIVASGYPITKRSSGELGLEISWHVMSILAGTPNATYIQGTIALVGPDSLLVPTSRTATSWTWHFYADEGQSLSYEEAVKYSKNFAFDHLVEFELHRMPSRRHFVGWAAEARVNCGTH